MGATKTSNKGKELTPDEEGAPKAPTSTTPQGSHLADFFGSAGGLFPAHDDARGKACSGNADLTVISPSLYLCDVIVDSSWASSYGDCLESNDWSSTKCANVASAMRLSATAVVDNPGDLHLKLSKFTVNARLDGRGDSTGTGEVSGVTHVETRAKETPHIGVEVPWLGTPEELGEYARAWWDGGSLDMTVSMDVDVETMGMSLHVRVPELFTAAKSRTVGSDSIADYSLETPRRARGRGVRVPRGRVSADARLHRGETRARRGVPVFHPVRQQTMRMDVPMRVTSDVVLRRARDC